MNWPMRKREWMAVTLALFAVALVTLLAAIWSGEGRWGLTGGLFAFTAYFCLFGLITARD